MDFVTIGQAGQVVFNAAALVVPVVAAGAGAVTAGASAWVMAKAAGAIHRGVEAMHTADSWAEMEGRRAFVAERRGMMEKQKAEVRRRADVIRAQGGRPHEFRFGASSWDGAIAAEEADIDRFHRQAFEYQRHRGFKEWQPKGSK